MPLRARIKAEETEWKRRYRYEGRGVEEAGGKERQRTRQAYQVASEARTLTPSWTREDLHETRQRRGESEQRASRDEKRESLGGNCISSPTFRDTGDRSKEVECLPSSGN